MVPPEESTVPDRTFVPFASTIQVDQLFASLPPAHVVAVMVFARQNVIPVFRFIASERAKLIAAII